MFEKLQLYGVIAAVFLILAGLGYWRWQTLVQQNSVLKAQNAQLTQNVKDKEKEISFLSDQSKLKDEFIQNNQKKVEEQKEKIDSLEDALKNVPGGDDQAVPYLKKFFEEYNKL